MLAMLSKEIITELREEALRLRRQASLIDEFLRGVDEAQSSTGEASAILGPSVTMPTDGTFAGKIRAALREIGHPTTSRAVASRLITHGSPTLKNGKPLRNSVSVELFRMAKNGTGGVRKVSRGVYRVAEDTTVQGTID